MSGRFNTSSLRRAGVDDASSDPLRTLAWRLMLRVEMHPARPPSLSPALAETLEVVVTATGAARDPWWIIGSAAMALHGAERVDPADVDLMMSPEDARRLLRDRGMADDSRDKHESFRSHVFGRLTDEALPIDVMGGFHFRRGGEWVGLCPESREAIALPFGAIFAPSLTELIEITRGFGRPKDLLRVQIMEDLRGG